MWITNGTRADFITLAVRTGEPGYGGISLVTFPTDVKGFPSARSWRRWETSSSDTAVLFFEDCRIPARCLLGEENQGFYHVMTNFQGERLVAAVGAVAGMQLLVDDAIRYGNERERLRQAAGAVPGVAAQVRRAPHRHRGGALAHLPRLRSLRPQGDGGEGDHHGQALRRRPGAAGGLRLHAVPRRHGLRGRDAGRPRLARPPGDDHRGRHVGDHEGDCRQGGA